MGWIVFLSFVLGFTLGIWMHMEVFYGTKPSGTLKLDISTGDPYLFLECHEPVEDILRKQTVVFDVEVPREENTH